MRYLGWPPGSLGIGDVSWRAARTERSHSKAGGRKKRCKKNADHEMSQLVDRAEETVPVGCRVLSGEAGWPNQKRSTNCSRASKCQPTCMRSSVPPHACMSCSFEMHTRRAISNQHPGRGSLASFLVPEPCLPAKVVNQSHQLLTPYSVSTD